MKKFILLLFILSIVSTVSLYSQSASGDYTAGEERFNRLSASVYGGYIFGERDRGQQIFASRFNVVSEPTWAAGTDLRYALTPFWSIEGGYRYSYLEGVGFETTVHTASIKNTFNLNRFYRSNRLSEVLNPYITLGVEQDIFDAQGPDAEFSRSEASLIGGLGLAVRASNRVEIFAQHEIKLSSNRLDLTDRGYPYDQIGMASGGIRLHFGKKGQKPLNLSPATRPVSVTEFESFDNYDDRLDELERKVEVLTERVDSLENRTDQMDRDHNEKFNDLFAMIDSLQARTDSLENCMCLSEEDLANMDGADTDERELRRNVPAGHYVQVFATQEYESAEQIRNRFRELLEGQLDDTEDEVFIIQRRQFYEVLIGTFEQFSAAQQILPPAVQELSDSFIITFPRPANLQEQYEGTVIIHDN